MCPVPDFRAGFREMRTAPRSPTSKPDWRRKFQRRMTLALRVLGQVGARGWESREQVDAVACDVVEGVPLDQDVGGVPKGDRRRSDVFEADSGKCASPRCCPRSQSLRMAPPARCWKFKRRDGHVARTPQLEQRVAGHAACDDGRPTEAPPSSVQFAGTLICEVLSV